MGNENASLAVVEVPPPPPAYIPPKEKKRQKKATEDIEKSKNPAKEAGSQAEHRPEQ
jgi:hypothetical protein